MHITHFGEKNFPLDYFDGHKHGRMFVLYCIWLEIKHDSGTYQKK